jgi:hypothetical protein
LVCDVWVLHGFPTIAQTEHAATNSETRVRESSDCNDCGDGGA